MKNRRIILVVAIVLVLWVTYVFLKESKSSKPVELPNEATSSAEMTRVTYVVDGDTIEVEGGRRIRYIGIDTPEIAGHGTKEECYGVVAMNKNISLVNGKTVRLVRDVSETDTYGRLLRYVYVGDEFVNDTLVRQGFAVTEPVKPDILFAPQLYAAQTEAKSGNRGLWQACQK